MKPSIEKIAIIGAGALGAAYGSLLYEMDPKCICFIASSARLERLRRDGVVVNGKHYPIAVVSPDEAEPADLLVVAVKHHHLDQAIAEMKKAIGPETTVLSVMNGIDSEERIGAVYGTDKLIYGLTLGIDAVREGNSVQYKNQGRIFFGEAKNPGMTDRIRRIHELFDRAGIAHVIPPDMIRSLWFKYMVNVGVNQVSAILRANYGALRTSPQARELMDAAMREVIAVARAMNVDLGEKDIGEWYKVLDGLHAEGKTSMFQDIEAGRKTEVEMLAGTVIELAKRCGVATPVNQRLYDELKRIEAALGAAT